MRKLSTVVLCATLLSFFPQAMAAKKKNLHDEYSGQGYGTAGCGLGSMVFGTKRGPIQVIAATLNGTSFSQTFGISSGTSNCDSPMGNSTSSLPFIEANRMALANDVARGQGETLSTLLEVYGCAQKTQAALTLQKNYETIFPHQSAQAKNIEAKIQQVLAETSVCQTMAQN